MFRAELNKRKFPFFLPEELTYQFQHLLKIRNYFNNETKVVETLGGLQNKKYCGAYQKTVEDTKAHP